MNQKYTFNIKDIEQYISDGLRYGEIAKKYGCSFSRMQSFIKQNNINYPHKIGSRKNVIPSKENLKKRSNTMKKLFKSGKYKIWSKGIKLSEEQKKNMMGKTPWNKGMSFSYNSKFNIDPIKVQKMLSAGKTQWEIAHYFNCSRGAIYHCITKNKLKKLNPHAYKKTKKYKDECRKRRMKQKFNFKDTYIEKIIKNVLIEKGISFIPQKKLLGITEVDFFIEPNVCIYCDGDYWHNLDYVIERDNRINKQLKENNFLVLRYTETNINKNIELVEKSIDCVSKYLYKG